MIDTVKATAQFSSAIRNGNVSAREGALFDHDGFNATMISLFALCFISLEFELKENDVCMGTKPI